MARHAQWPTPTSSDYRGAQTLAACQEWEHRGTNLPEAVQLAEAGLWPTPQARDGDDRRGAPSPGLAASRWKAGRRNLEDAVALFPTPRATDAVAGPDPGHVDRHGTGGPSLTTFVNNFPTPTVNDSKNNGGPAQYDRNDPGLNGYVGGPLNPTWVEWLMGFPLGWTDCEPSATP